VKKKLRIVYRALSETGVIYKVPLDDTADPPYAIISEDDWLELRDMGLNPIWGLCKKTGRVTVWCENKRQRVYVDRIV
jgi:hypothetical protein